MSTDPNQSLPSDTQRWWQSRTVWCAAVPLIVSLAHFAGVTLSPDVQATLPDVLMTVAAAVGSAGAMFYRIRASKTIISTAQKDQ